MNQEELIKLASQPNDESEGLPEFLRSQEWFLYQEGLLDQVAALYFELWTLKADKPDFVSRFCWLQGHLDGLLLQLRRFETASKISPEQKRFIEYGRRIGLIDRIKGIIIYAIGANDA